MRILPLVLALFLIPTGTLPAFADCNAAVTTVEMAECGGKELAQAQQDLAKAEHDLAQRAAAMDKASNAHYQVSDKLDVARKAFDTYAEAQCQYARATLTNGSLAGIAYTSCKTELITTRLGTIKAELAH